MARRYISESRRALLTTSELSSIVGIIAQRLVRKLCPVCKRMKAASDREKELLHIPVEEEFMVYEPCGCEKCGGTGYKGRTAIYEIMPNVPVGYEGLVYGSGHPGNVQIFEKEDSKPTKAYAMIEDGLKRDFLGDYSVELGTKYTKNNGLWWRETDLTKKKTADGYFEYVGEKKGLYYINTDMVKGEDGAENGIGSQIQALPRSGSEAGKGEYAVKEPRYYWAKDYSGSAAYPTEEVKSRTGFHYDLTFRLGEESPKEYHYRVYGAKAREEAQGKDSGRDGNVGTAAEEGQFDYFAKVTEGTEDAYTFEKYKGGNYALNTGAFTYVGIGKGSYIPEREAVIRGREWNTQNEVIFEHAGSGKGVYDVAFIYGEKGAGTKLLYRASLKRVSNLKGRYALTSAAAETDKTGLIVPVYEEKQGGDYSRVITAIDCAGIDFTDKVNGSYASVSPFGAGVRIGMRESNYDVEWGEWVFHELSDMAETDYTKVKDVKGKKTFQPGDRIYVSRQNRFYRYYCRNSFRNNEWFKLMCYMDNPGNLSLAYSDKGRGKRHRRLL